MPKRLLRLSAATVAPTRISSTLTADLFGQSAEDLAIHMLSGRGAYSQRL
jgi:hypothetical protein